MPGIFDNKNFNAEVFGKYVERVPNTKRTELLKSRAIRPRPDLKQMMSDQVGGNYVSTPLKGLISGSTPQNYDGQTNITAGTTKTFMHSRVVVGRMNAWVEKDFSYDITGGEDFLANVAEQIAEYWEEVDQDTLLSILKGVFSMTTGTKNKEFVSKHTFDISEASGEDKDKNPKNCVGATTVNTAMQQALGDNKAKFSLAIMHSVVATNLENLKLIAYLKYTDAAGLQRDIGLGTLHGRLVLIDDSMPAIAIPAVEASEGVQAQEAYTQYTTYLLGEGAIEYTDCGAKVPYEADRNPSVNGGEDTLYSRQRHCYAPYGISFTKASMATASPTSAELENGSNWELVNTSGSSKEYIDHKSIPIARIISRG
ncbi:phage coat protein [Clostridium botulinum]|uniref:phage coat protein n=1 Tax=Clostridium botulinum TaxID=1491 RepID=UPI001400A05C|nr:phage coat protein [Clostridium botulinum]MBY6916051.1 phage coat protein [Clostridium botulinum]NFQ39510.1 phage coat protein [Clostridium botulinum]